MELLLCPSPVDGGVGELLEELGRVVVREVVGRLRRMIHIIIIITIIITFIYYLIIYDDVASSLRMREVVGRLRGIIHHIYIIITALYKNVARSLITCRYVCVCVCV